MRFFHQEDLNDCGLACLAMIISHYHHQYVSPYWLKKMCANRLQGGISFYDLIDLAANFNLRGSAYFCEFDFLQSQKKLPLLLNIKDENDINHFVLLTELTANKIKILDPAFKFGHRELTWKELQNCYLGQIIIFEKLKKWQPKVAWKPLFSYIQKYWAYLFLTALVTILSNYFWFLTSFLIRHLENWALSGTTNYWILLEYGCYFGVGSICYLAQIYLANYLRQILWNQLVSINLKHLETKDNLLESTGGFWEVINHQHQAINLFFTFLIKFISHLAIMPLTIWIIFKTNLWILFVYLFFVLCNGIINHFSLKFHRHTEDEMDWKKSNYYNQLAFYLSNFKNIKRRQYHKINLSLLNNHQNKYFDAERKHHFWISLTDLNQQLTQRIFGLAFWFSIFLFVFKNLNPINDLLILSLTLQLSISLTIDLLHNWFLFWHQKDHFYNLVPWTKSGTLQHNSLYNSDNEQQSIIQFQDFSFETPGGFHLLENSSFQAPLQILGSKLILDSFYNACLTTKSSLFINFHPIEGYQDKFFAIDYESIPVASTIADNLFLGLAINSQIVKLINLEHWLSKYNLDLNNSTGLTNLSKEQLQVISFLSLLLSDYELYFLNQPLDAIGIEDQQLLWELLFKLKENKVLIIFGDVKSKNQFPLAQMILEDMI